LRCRAGRNGQRNNRRRNPGQGGSTVMRTVQCNSSLVPFLLQKDRAKKCTSKTMAETIRRWQRHSPKRDD
jgi:hypothetical protein